jgi:ferredoxin
VCGDTNYPLSCGGPGICPSCDCGIDPEVARLRKEVRRLTVELKLAKGELLTMEDLLP